MIRSLICNLLVCAMLFDCAAPVAAQAVPVETPAADAPAALPALPASAPAEAPTEASAAASPAAALFMPICGGGTVGKDYRIASGDSLVISVMPAQEFARNPVVLPDGNIDMPMIGLVPARGLTTEALTRELAERISHLVAKPRVTVSVVAFGFRMITVMGEVNSPSSYEFKEGMGMLELIGKAGGIKDTTRLDKIRIFRREGAGYKSLVVDFRPVLVDGDMTKDIPLRSSDIIMFPMKSVPRSARWITDNFGAWISVLTLILTTVLIVKVQ
jgi:polysaccharide export outer membrane protein